VPPTDTITPPPPASELPVIIQREEVSDVLLAAFAALGYAVSARALLFIALIGAFCLAVMSMLSQSVMSVIVLGVYLALTVLPMVFLELRAKRNPD
jgi:hypothetical protein